MHQYGTCYGFLLRISSSIIYQKNSTQCLPTSHCLVEVSLPLTVSMLCHSTSIILADRDAAHLPALAKLGTLVSLKAVWSRSESSSTKAAEAWKSLTGQQVTRYSENGSDDLENLLSRKDIDAVIIALPILSQANIIARALQAGKHVLSEKPVAKDVATATKMLQDYQINFQPQGLVSSVHAQAFPPLLKVLLRYGGWLRTGKLSPPTSLLPKP